VAIADKPSDLVRLPRRHSDDTAHTAHCHQSVATCSEQPVPTDLRVLQAVVELEQPYLVEVAKREGQISPVEYVSSIPTEPPRRLDHETLDESNTG
jgi:hypothetical protein